MTGNRYKCTLEMWLRILLVSLVALTHVSSLSPDTFLTVTDKIRLKKVFDSALGQRDLTGLNYAVRGLLLLREPIANKDDLCQFLQTKLVAGSSAEVLNLAASTAKLLPSCTFKPPTDAEKTLNAAITEESSVATVSHGFLGLKAFGLKTDDAKVAKALLSVLKKDDSLNSLGQVFQVGSQLKGDISALFDRIEDAIVQADEVDGTMLQFEGGLSLTSLVVSGAYRLAQTANKPPPITNDQAVKFANYFLSRKSVQLAKGAFNLLDILHLYSDNKVHRPIAITLVGPSSVTDSQPKVSVRVTDLLGNILGPLIVTADSATRLEDGAVVLSKEKFIAVGTEASLYQLHLMQSKPSKGFYRVTVTATPATPDKRIIGNTGVVEVKVLTIMQIDGGEIGVADADQTTPPKMITLSSKAKLETPLEADQQQRLVLRASFSSAGKTDKGRPLKLQQVFLRLEHLEEKREIVFLSESEADGAYKFDLDIGARSNDFGHLSGLYFMELLIGDAVISNSDNWPLGNIKLTFTKPAASEKTTHPLYKPKPEITHVFRTKEKRPPTSVSNAFTALAIAPVLIMLILWVKIGANLRGMPFSIFTLGFHIGLGAIFALYVIFWLRLNMFTTIKCLTGVGTITFLCGHKLLARIAQDRKTAS